MALPHFYPSASYFKCYSFAYKTHYKSHYTTNGHLANLCPLESDECMLPLHLFLLVSYQGNGSRRWVAPVLFLCFPESEWSVFSLRSKVLECLMTWRSAVFSGLLWRWLDLKCASCDPKPFIFLFMLFPHNASEFGWCCDVRYMFCSLRVVMVSPRWNLNAYKDKEHIWHWMLFRNLSIVVRCIFNKHYDLKAWEICSNVIQLTLFELKILVSIVTF